jgi:indolepyruvate ferredoxin oxidoreductase beta subunit
MSSWTEGNRPLTIAILALGGEGGGVLSDWIVATAECAGYYAQNTSVAGVAQRTGATVYYVELFPPLSENRAAAATTVRREPVMSIFPTPGEVDVVITSELMESGRAIQRGFATPDRTIMITSTNRVYSIDEKMALSDGRVDDGELLAAAARASKRLIAANFMQIAEESGSVISASLFGALAGSGALPFSRAQFEVPIREFGKAAEPSLRAFAAGFAEASATNDPAESPLSISYRTSPARSQASQKDAGEARRLEVARSDPDELVGPALKPLAGQVRAFPAEARSMILHGLVRTAVYQDVSYARSYLDRVERFARADPEAEGEARLTLEAARCVALWMCYQDTIHVALQKTRRARMERVRKEAKARPDQLLEVREFLHPQIDEITDMLPTRLGAFLHESLVFGRLVHRITHRGMILNTTSVVGYTLLSVMARMRPLRPRSLRFGLVQQEIEAWIDQALNSAEDPALAREIVACQQVLKGYGSTHAHGHESFTKLMDAARSLRGAPNAAEQLAELRSAALEDEDGAALAALLAA